MQNTNLKSKRSLCHEITEKYRDSWDPIKKGKFRGKCKDFMYEGEKICDIIWDRFDPEYGKEADPDPSWRPKRWCVYKPQRNTHSKSTENMYKKGELNRSTNIGAIINERERIKTLKKKEENRKAKIAKEINKDNFSSIRTPNKTWKYLRKKKDAEAEEGKFNSFKSPKNAWKYKNTNKVEKRKAATNYELADVNSYYNSSPYKYKVNSNYNSSSDENEVENNFNFSKFKADEDIYGNVKVTAQPMTVQPVPAPTPT